MIGLEWTQTLCSAMELFFFPFNDFVISHKKNQIELIDAIVGKVEEERKKLIEMDSSFADYPQNWWTCKQKNWKKIVYHKHSA